MNPALAFPGSCAITPASKWRKERLFKLPGLPTVALVLFLACQFTGRASTNITTASFASLQSAVAVGGTITLSFDGTIATTNSLIISNNTVLLTLTNSVTISGGPSNRLFQVLTNVSLTVSNLTLSGGHSISTNGANGANGTNGSGGSN